MRTLGWLVAVALLGLPQASFAASFALIVGGLGGAPEYDERFAAQVARFEKWGVAWAGGAERVTAISGEGATREALQRAIAALAKRVERADTFALVLVGHGTFDGEDYKLNLRGPDVTAKQLAAWLAPIRAGRQLVVNTSSGSGASLDALRADGRIVIVATRSGQQIGATRFAEFWLDALSDASADLDKDGAISVVEAFERTERGLADAFERDVSFATETPKIEGADGPALRVAQLTPLAAAASPAKTNARVAQIEAEIAALRAERDALGDAYFERLEPLLLELAELEAELEDTPGGSSGTEAGGAR